MAVVLVTLRDSNLMVEMVTMVVVLMTLRNSNEYTVTIVKSKYSLGDADASVLGDGTTT